MTLVNLTIELIGYLLNALGQIALKAGVIKIGYIDTHTDFFHFYNLRLLHLFFLGLFCCAASLAVLIIELSRVPSSTTCPMLSLCY